MRWGCFSGVAESRATALVRRALQEPFGHAVLLSEQCYPIRPLAELTALLEGADDTDFIQSRHVRTEWSKVKMRFERSRIWSCCGTACRVTWRVTRAVN